MIYALTFILGFCSIAYEPLLGQSLSAFLGNTVLRYSVTIGLYMFSMGVGSLIAEGRRVAHPVVALLKIELLLTLTGGFSVLVLLALNSVDSPDILFSALAHLLIVVIGVLTGVETPLLVELKSLEQRKAESSIIGVDYLGAFAGTVVFAFVFYPRVGLIATAFYVAALNAFVGVCLISQGAKVKRSRRRQYRGLLACQSALLVVLFLCLRSADTITEIFLEKYLAS